MTEIDELLKETQSFESYRDLAIADYDKVLGLDPTNKEAWYRKGLIYFHDEQYDKAIECYDKVLAIDPQYNDAWISKGYAYYGKGQYDKAIDCIGEEFKRTSAKEPLKGCYIFEERGFMNKQMLFKHAPNEFRIKCYEKALAINPRLKEVWEWVGTIYYRDGQYDKATECFDKALAIDPLFKEAWNGKGLVYYSKKHYDKALECFDKALAIDPNYEKAKQDKESATNTIWWNSFFKWDNYKLPSLSASNETHSSSSSNTANSYYLLMFFLAVGALVLLTRQSVRSRVRELYARSEDGQNEARRNRSHRR